LDEHNANVKKWRALKGEVDPAAPKPATQKPAPLNSVVPSPAPAAPAPAPKPATKPAPLLKKAAP
jgi:hypothetical protein